MSPEIDAFLRTILALVSNVAISTMIGLFLGTIPFFLAYWAYHLVARKVTKPIADILPPGDSLKFVDNPIFGMEESKKLDDLWGKLTIRKEPTNQGLAGEKKDTNDVWDFLNSQDIKI